MLVNRNMQYVLLLIIYLSTYYTWLFVCGYESNIALIGENIISLLGVTVALVWTARIYFRNRSWLKKYSLHRFWLFILMGLVFYFFSELAWNYNRFILMEVPFPSWTDYFYLIYYGFIFLAIGDLLRKEIKHYLFSQSAFDFAIYIITIGTITWYFLIEPSIINFHSMETIDIIVSVGYLISAPFLLFLTFMLIVLSRYKFPKVTLSLIVVSFFILTFADLTYLYLSIEETSSFFSIMTSPLFAFSSLLIAFSFKCFEQYANKEKGNSEDNMNPNSIATLTIQAIPFVLLVSLYCLFLWELSHHEFNHINSPLTVIFSIILASVLIRQVVLNQEKEKLLSEVQTFNHKLEKRVSEQTTILTLKNKELETLLTKINHQADHDALTGLPNRKYFIEKLSRAIEESGKSLAVLFIDLDRFKMINDTLGHDFGDKLLKVVARRLKECVGGEDIVSRLGGDEFIILLEDVNEKQSSLIASRIITTLNEPFLIDNHELYITPSIGISLYPKDGTSVEKLIKSADIAMYAVKEKGKNSYHFYDSEIKKAILRKSKIENNLRYAIKNDEFSLHYHPIVNLKNGEIIGNESLLRWHNAELGNVSPKEFIPVAEETGFITAIGEWVLKEACRQTKEWHDQGHELKVSVNVSTIQFRDKYFKRNVKQILRETGLDPQYLYIEITESVMQNSYEATCILNDLKEIGLQLAIDDFGTGFSSLNYLKDLPIDVIKIDKSFTEDMVSNERNIAIVKTIIDLSNNLNMSVIAEGIETDEQITLLKVLHCDHGQGGYFSQPLSAEEFEGRVLDKKIKAN